MTRFLDFVLDTSKRYYYYSAIEQERKSFLKNNQAIEMVDYGAGSVYQHTGLTVRVSSIAKRALSSPTQGRIMANIVQFLRPSTILELGTSLGISSLYLGMGNSSATVWTLEGNPAVANLAQELFSRMNTNNIQLVTGPFESTLSNVLNQLETIDFIYLDGNHRKEPTIYYVEQIMPQCTDSTIIILDDIRWSKEMYDAWEIIKRHPSVSSSLELWKLGILFLNPSLSKEHHIIIPYYLKPWRIGLFGK